MKSDLSIDPPPSATQPHGMNRTTLAYLTVRKVVLDLNPYPKPTEPSADPLSSENYPHGDQPVSI